MSLLEEWQSQDLARLSSDLEGPDGSLGTGDASTLEAQFGISSAKGSEESPIFTLEVVERNIARGRGQVTAAAAANSLIIVVTSRGWLLRYDLAQGPTPVTELELTKSPEATATGVWTDATATHCIAIVKTLGSWETFYLHAKWKKARLLGKLKGIQVTAASWQTEAITEIDTGEIALGTQHGTVVSITCNEKEKKERGGKVVLDLSELKEPVRGLQQLALQNDRLLLLLSTATRLYAFCGQRSLEELGPSYPSVTGLSNYMELPSDAPSGSLECYTPPGGTRPKRFAWLAGPGLYKGGLDITTEQQPPSELDYLVDHNLLPLPLSAALQEYPLAVAQTEYHEVILYKSRLHIVNRVSQALVQEVNLVPSSSIAAATINPLGFVQDTTSGSLFMFTGDSLVEVISQNEDRNMWKVYLSRNEFANAFRRCRNQAQRNAVNSAEAALAFGEGRHLAAAKLWGKVTSPPPSFEEIALNFVQAGTPDALQAFLLTKLDTLSPTDKAQATMVATWLTELYLDRINRALLEGTDGQPVVEQLVEELRDFLKLRVDLLDVKTTINLLASYGRLDDLMHYASYRQDNEAVLEYLVQRGDAKRALSILRRPDVSHELFYKFSPSLMALTPSDTVDAWITANPPLQPNRLLPALLRYAEEGAPPDCRASALRYVTFCLQRLQTLEPAVHQLAVSLYCIDGDEKALMDYLASAKDAFDRPLYDPQAALRLARQQKLQRVCVELLWELKLYEEAVASALEFDMQQAILLASRPQEDDLLQRKLWLSIATHLIRLATSTPDGDPGESIKKINDLMREAGGLVKIEDVLPLFPDFVQIDNFKEAICQSLEDYNTQIAGLKSEMDDATRIADALRSDVASLEQRKATLDLSEPCARCDRPVGEAPPPGSGPSGGAVPPYFLFPTGNAFHGSCLAYEVMALTGTQRKTRIQFLLNFLSEVRESNPSSITRDVKDMQESFRAEVSQEDPYNGELVIKNIDQPFVVSSEADEIQSWQL